MTKKSLAQRWREYNEREKRDMRIYHKEVGCPTKDNLLCLFGMLCLTWVAIWVFAPGIVLPNPIFTLFLALGLVAYFYGGIQSIIKFEKFRRHFG